MNSVSLTVRERQVLALVAEGMSNKEISRVLGISARTVETHAEHVRIKMGVRNRVEMAVAATRHGLQMTMTFR